MSRQLKIERQFDAKPDVVFDAFVDPEAQEELHGSAQAGWSVRRAETDVRVGGTSIYAMGGEGEEPDIETRVFSVVERPSRLVFRHSMAVAEWGRIVDTEMTITFEEQEGKTLLTMLQTGFDNDADRDSFLAGWSDYLNTLAKHLKTRHDS